MLCRCRARPAGQALASTVRKAGADRVEAQVGALTPEERQRYEHLRKWRNGRATKDGRPPYLLLTNQQVLEVARRDPSNAAELAQIEGIGHARLDTWGDDILATLASLRVSQGDPARSTPEAS